VLAKVSTRAVSESLALTTSSAVVTVTTGSAAKSPSAARYTTVTVRLEFSGRSMKSQTPPRSVSTRHSPMPAAMDTTLSAGAPCEAIRRNVASGRRSVVTVNVFSRS
jgi:hypothetical protein